VQKYLNLESQAWERLILLEEAKRRKLNIGDQEVVNTIRNTPYFQKKSVFDNKTYVDVLHYVFRLKPRVFEEQMRQNLILAELYKQVTADVKADENEVRQEWIKANEELSIYYIASLFSEFAKKIKPTDKEISAYYEKNKEAFKEPASINLEYVITESEAEAKKLSELISKKYNLKEISEELKLAKKETGSFKQYTPPAEPKIPQETLSLLLNQKEGQPAPMVKIDKVYYAFALKDKKPGRIPELDKMKDKINQIIINQETRKAAQDKMKTCSAELKKNKPLEKVAKAHGLKVEETKFFKSTDNIDKLGQAQLFWETAKKLKEGQTSEPFSDQNGFYIIKLKGINPIDETKFNEEKTGVEERILTRKKNELFAKFIEETKKKAQ
jgi:peptidyl-prolyl cis-trans isomerase D